MGLFKALMGSKKQDENDAETVKVNEHLLDKVSDADAESKHKVRWGSGYRQNLSIEEVEELAVEAKLRKWGWGRN